MRLLLPLVLLSLVACVTTGTHEAVLAELDKTKRDLAAREDKLAATTSERDSFEAKTKELEAQGQALDAKLTDALNQNNQLITKVSSMGQNVEALLGEKDKMGEERKRLAAEVDEARRMRASAEARAAEFQKLIGKLAKLIDAGTLKIKPRNGMLVVTMASDVLFPPGGTTIKPEAKVAIEELAKVMATFGDRKFLIVGHSDATPIKTDRFPSNWELSSQRAIEVARLMVEFGVPPEMLRATGAAEFDPVAPNDTRDNKTQNRRVEIIFLPKLDELPGLEDVLKKKAS